MKIGLLIPESILFMFYFQLTEYFPKSHGHQGIFDKFCMSSFFFLTNIGFCPLTLTLFQCLTEGSEVHSALHIVLSYFVTSWMSKPHSPRVLLVGWPLLEKFTAVLFS